jgi:hypothetical protein
MGHFTFPQPLLDRYIMGHFTFPQPLLDRYIMGHFTFPQPLLDRYIMGQSTFHHILHGKLQSTLTTNTPCPHNVHGTVSHFFWNKT